CSSPSAARSNAARTARVATQPTHTAAELAERYSLGLRGDGAVAVRGVSTLARAGAGQLSFLANPRYRAQLAASAAGVVVMRESDADGFAGTALLAADPYATFARIAALFEQREAIAAGIHSSAVVDASARVDPGAS